MRESDGDQSWRKCRKAWGAGVKRRYYKGNGQKETYKNMRNTAKHRGVAK